MQPLRTPVWQVGPIIQEWKIVRSFSLISDSISGARGQQDGADTLLGHRAADGLFELFHCSSAEATATWSRGTWDVNDVGFYHISASWAWDCVCL